MFTGLIESVCKVNSAVSRAGGIKLQINIGQTVKNGESIAVNGVCLTVTGQQGDKTEFDVSGETLSKTTIGSLRPGVMVNIERAIAADGRFGGHFVQGHIDAVGKVKKIERQGEFWLFVFETPKDVLDYVVPKGSITIDGTSLTIASLEKNNFSTAIIPATFENTIFKNYKVSDLVNVETDMICRMVKKQLENILHDKSNLSIDKLKSLGF